MKHMIRFDISWPNFDVFGQTCIFIFLHDNFITQGGYCIVGRTPWPFGNQLMVICSLSLDDHLAVKWKFDGYLMAWSFGDRSENRHLHLTMIWNIDDYHVMSFDGHLMHRLSFWRHLGNRRPVMAIWKIE